MNANVTLRKEAIALNRALRVPRLVRSSLIAIADFAGLAGSLWVSLMAPHWDIRLLAGLIAPVWMARLFILGHDACHGSLVRSGWVNRVMGRLLLLPTLTPYSTWEYGHNVLHHAYTNLRTHDYVYAPFDIDEFRALPVWRRVLERVYRSELGLGLYYMIDIWWRKLFFPAGADRSLRIASITDSALVSGYGAMWAGLSWFAGRAHGDSGLLSLLCSAVMPFLVWNYLMGFVTFQHHTNSAVPWFDDRAEWNRHASQLECTVHVVFPGWIGALLGNIMEHTAHHVDTKLPMWSLPKAQTQIEGRFGSLVPHVDWTWTRFRNTVRDCKLYDYRAHRWADFEGNYTTERTISLIARD